jgi:hypothetical protein
MPANQETTTILTRFAVPEFEAAIAQAHALMDPSERVLCAGMAAVVANENEQPVVNRPSPYYVVTTAGLHYGLLKKKTRDLLVGAIGENRFVPRSAIGRYETDNASAVDLRSDDGELLAGIVFSDALGLQLVRTADDATSILSGHQREVAAIDQLRNVLEALDLPAGS